MRRRILLGTVAAVLAIWYLTRKLPIDTREVLDFALASVLLVAACIVAALVAASLLRFIRRRR